MQPLVPFNDRTPNAARFHSDGLRRRHGYATLFGAGGDAELRVEH